LKFSLCNEFFEGWAIEEVFEQARRLGYEGVEIAPFTLADSVREVSAARRREIAAAAASEGLEIVGLHWLLVRPEGLHINHPDQRVRNRTRDCLTALVDFCSDLGGKIMVLGSPRQRIIQEGWSKEDSRARTLEVVRQVLPRAQAQDVAICLEPLARWQTNFINTAREAIELIREVDHPNFQLILDVASLARDGADVPEVIRSSATYLRHFHANDPNQRGPGFGAVDFIPVFKALSDIRYPGFVSVEVFDFMPDPITIAGGSIAYMEECLRKATGGV